MLGSQTLVNISKEPALCWKLGNPPLHLLEKTYMQLTLHICNIPVLAFSFPLYTYWQVRKIIYIYMCFLNFFNMESVKRNKLSICDFYYDLVKTNCTNIVMFGVSFVHKIH